MSLTFRQWLAKAKISNPRNQLYNTTIKRLRTMQPPDIRGVTEMREYLQSTLGSDAFALQIWHNLRNARHMAVKRQARKIVAQVQKKIAP